MSSERDVISARNLAYTLKRIGSSLSEIVMELSEEFEDWNFYVVSDSIYMESSEQYIKSYFVIK